jgi:alpha-beta hydrolase superfamily lysophospholipase
MLKLCKWCWRRRWRTLLLFFLTAFFVLNYLAYQHAHALTHYAPSGGWSGKPEKLSPLSKASALLFGVQMARPEHDATPASIGLEGESHTVAGSAGELSAWYVPHDRPRGVVLIFHGFGGCKARMLPEARGFHEQGFACFLVDFRGCGGSEGNTTTIGFHEAEDVASAVSYVRARWTDQSVLLFGQSMGAAAVLRAVGVLDVQADALVLECPFDRMLTAVRARFRALGVTSFPLAEALVFWGGAQHGFNAFAHDPVSYARDVHCPVLLMHGTIDGRVRQSEVRAIYEQLHGKKALHFFESLGHHSYFSRRPAEWSEQVERFLARVNVGR